MVEVGFIVPKNMLAARNRNSVETTRKA